MSFTNKVVLVTGASSGIGAATAKSFSKEGADVAMVGRNEAKLKKVAQECANIGKSPLVIIADLAKDEDADRVIKETVEKYGKLDVLVNNAGLAIFGCLSDGKAVSAYDEIMRVNVRAVIQLTTLATPHLIKTKGNVVNISSVVGKMVLKVPQYLSYAISKAAIDHFTRYAAVELASSGVRVNAVSPGPVRTDFLDNCGASMTWDELGSYQPLKRVSEPEEIADIVLFLASDKAKGVTGSDYVCDNGGSYQ